MAALRALGPALSYQRHVHRAAHNALGALGPTVCAREVQIRYQSRHQCRRLCHHHCHLFTAILSILMPTLCPAGSANNIKTGNYLEYEGKLCQVKNTTHVKPGKGAAYVQVDLHFVRRPPRRT